MMNNQSNDADSKARRQAEERARRRREEEERRRREEEERRRREEEERKRREEEARKRKQQEAGQQAKQAALEAAQFGWQPPQQPKSSWQPNTIDKMTEEAVEKPQPKAAPTYAEAVYGGAKAQPQPQRQAEEKEGTPQPQGKPYARTLMDNVLAHKGDMGDPFLMELNSESWEQEYRDGRTKAFRDAVGQLADGLLTDKVKPEEGLGKGGVYTSGDLADPFLQGLFGEQELKNEFVKGQMEQFTPALERRIQELREKAGGTGKKDMAQGRDMAYTMDKQDPTESAGQSLIQPMSAQAGNTPTYAEAVYGGAKAQPQGNKAASTEDAKTAGGSGLDLGMGPITQEKADEARAAGAQNLKPEGSGIRDWLEANPDVVLPNGMNAETLRNFEDQYLPDKGTETITAPSKDGVDFPDFTDKLTKYLEGIVEECKTAKEEQGVLALADWINKVRPEGVWDPKSNTKQIREALGYSENEKLPDRFYFNGRLMNLEEIGNLMYGVSGSAVGFSPEALSMGSQAVQDLVDFGRNFNHPVFGDEYLERLEEQAKNEQKDQDAIRRGIDYYEQHFGK